MTIDFYMGFVIGALVTFFGVAIVSFKYFNNPHVNGSIPNVKSIYISRDAFNYNVKPYSHE